MMALVWLGTALALLGLAGLIWCIGQARRLRGKATDPDEVRRVLRRLQAVNMASVGLAFFGLAFVTVALILS